MQWLLSKRSVSLLPRLSSVSLLPRLSYVRPTSRSNESSWRMRTTQTRIPGGEVALSISSRSQRLKMFIPALSDCLLPQHRGSHTGNDAFQSQWAPLRFIITETHVLSHFLLSRDENSQCSVALKISHLFPGVRCFGLAAACVGIAFKSLKVWSSISPKSSLFSFSIPLQACLHFFFFFNFKVRTILLRGRRGLEMH